MKERCVIWGKPTLSTIKNIINYFVCVVSRGVFQGSALKTVFSVLFFLKCIKKIRGPYDILSFFVKKNMF